MKTGRPSLLETWGITIDDLRKTYRRLGTYQKVADHYSTTKRTVCKYLTGTTPRGRRKGSYTSPSRRFVDNHPDMLLLGPMALAREAAKAGLSPSYVRVVVTEKNNQMLQAIKDEVTVLLRSSAAIRDTKGRYIPTAAVRYVWVPKWHWDRPVYVRVVLRDGTKAKLPTLFRPTPSHVTVQWDE